MTGYKRVNFYELCRLCASNIQKEHIHIFQEDGRKIQLQSKIQTCLALTVNEDDFLPKVVCSKCLQNLETCLIFRQECVRSESMLSAYFKNFRYTEDFKKSGKVYIKDTKPTTQVAVQQNPEVSTSTNQPVIATIPNVIVNKNQQAVDQSPFYTLQFPRVVTNSSDGVVKSEKDPLELDAADSERQHQFAYNINLINQGNIKTAAQKTEMLSNVVVNSNGEVLNIAHMGDFETILSQGSSTVSKTKYKKRTKDIIINDDAMVKIDFTNADVSTAYELDQQNTIVNKYEKHAHIKNTTVQNKFTTYSVKVDDKTTTNQNVIFSNAEYNQTYNNSFSTSSNNNLVYTQPNINIVTTNTISTSSNIVCNAAQAASSVDNNSAMALNVMDENVAAAAAVSINNQTTYNSNIVSTTNTSECEVSKSSTQTTDIINTSTTTSSNVHQQQQQQKTHVCEICLKSFKRREHLGQHVKLHTGFRPYICEHCQKSFMRKEHLMRHSTLHSGQKNYTCNICEKSFSRNDNLLKHKKTHEKQSSYTCEICQKHFVMKHYYNAHKLTHGEKCFVSTVWGMLKT